LYASPTGEYCLPTPPILVLHRGRPGDSASSVRRERPGRDRTDSSEREERPMVKGAQKRLDATVDFIRKEPNLRAEVRQVVADYCEYFMDIDRVGPVYTTKAHLKTFSESLSQRNNPSAGEKPERHYRRAIHMMYQSLGDGAARAAVDTMAEAALVPAFKKLAKEIYLYWDKTGAACRAKLDELRTSPKQFLEENEIFINGHKKKEAGHVRGPAWFLMSYDPGRKRFVFEPMGGEQERADQPGYRFRAIHVPAVSHDDLSEHRNFQELVPTELKDLDIMLTTQFSGCSFCVQRSGGKVYAAHISPDEARTKQDPIALAGALGGTGGAAGGAFKGVGGPGFTVYGRGAPDVAGDAGYAKALKAMLIIGVRDKTGTWEVFSQHVGLDKGSKPKVYPVL
jgi:hypothetical protein